MGELIIRVIHKAGRNRIVLKDTDKISKLQEEIAKLVSVSFSNVDIYYDQSFKQRVKESGSTSLKKAKFQNGIQIFVKNQEAKFTTEIVVQKSFVVPETDDAEMKEEMKEETKEEHYGQTSDAKMEEEQKPEESSAEPEKQDQVPVEAAEPKEEIKEIKPEEDSENKETPKVEVPPKAEKKTEKPTAKKHKKPTAKHEGAKTSAKKTKPTKEA